MSAQIDLREPDQMDWDNYNPGSKYTPPPQAKGQDGKYIPYFGQVKSKFEEKDFKVTDEGFRSYELGPVTIVKSGSSDGYQIRFVNASVKKFKRGDKVIDASQVGNFLKACQITQKPQKNSEYDAAIKATAGRTFPFTLDWEARNRDTGEEVKGYNAFPLDPDRPGQRKSILKAGDLVNVLDDKGNPTGQTVVVKSEVLFANARVKYYVDPNRK